MKSIYGGLADCPAGFIPLWHGWVRCDLNDDSESGRIGLVAGRHLNPQARTPALRCRALLRIKTPTLGARRAARASSVRMRPIVSQISEQAKLTDPSC